MKTPANAMEKSTIATKTPATTLKNPGNTFKYLKNGATEKTEGSKCHHADKSGKSVLDLLKSMPSTKREDLTQGLEMFDKDNSDENASLFMRQGSSRFKISHHDD